jgi:hypothetical protein
MISKPNYLKIHNWKREKKHKRTKQKENLQEPWCSITRTNIRYTVVQQGLKNAKRVESLLKVGH